MTHNFGRFRRSALACAVALAAVQPVQAQDEDPALEEMHILGVREDRASKGATGLNLTLFQTPQSVTVIDREFIDSFALDDVNQVLKLTTGVNVDEVETDRTYYNSRGFDIKSMQVDGHGLPFTWNVVGDIDTAVYEKVEVIRGANGLLTGTGNPSGTINYVRKRPTNNRQGSVDASVGSWNYKRLTADASTPLTASGSWAARGVVAYLDTDSHLDHYSRERTLVYGVVDGQLSANSTLTAGYTWQQARSEGVLWGALPLLDTNGVQQEYDTSATTTMDWTFWETDTSNVFVEYRLDIGHWAWTTTLNYNDYEEPSELFYVYGSPDPESRLGLYGWPGKYLSTTEQKMVDSILAGGFSFAGRDHEVLFGVNLSRSDNGYLDYPAPGDSPAWGALPAFPGWRGNEIPRPDFENGEVASDFTTDVRRFYAVANWNLADTVNLITGANRVDAETSGYSFGDTMDWSEKDTSPYVGVTWTVNGNVNLYASYSDIFEPQSELNADLRNIGPAKGTSMEAGTKVELADGRLIGTVALFQADQENYAEYAGFDTDSGLSYYQGTDVTSKGFELEALGAASDSLFVMAGYTQMTLTGADGEDVRTFIPRRTFKLGLRYNPLWLAGLEMGTSVRWQSDIYTGAAPAVVSQDSYALLSAYVDYAITANLSASLNIDNLTDEKYLNSLYWDQSYYGEPQSVKARVTYSF